MPVVRGPDGYELRRRVRTLWDERSRPRSLRQYASAAVAGADDPPDYVVEGPDER